MKNWEPVSKSALKTELRKVLAVGIQARQDISENFVATGASATDPFSAIISAALAGNWDAWTKSEIDRQVGKSISNQIGYFHQELIGAIPGWQSIPRGGQMPDLVCHERKLFVELKNKFNTVKGSDRIGVYNSLVQNESERYKGWIGAYAYIVENSTTAQQEKPILFTPSDARNKKRVEARSHVIQLTGRLLWAIALDDRDGVPMPPYPRIDAIDQVLRMTLEIVAEDFKDFRYPEPALMHEFTRSLGGER